MQRPIQLGRLRHRVSVQRPTEAPDSYGEPVQTWTTVAERWAEIDAPTGREFVRAQQVFAEVTHVIRMRYLTGVKAKWRGLFGGRVFEFGPPLNPGEQGHTTLMEITAKELV
jgi:SPP1 family predicted phage head-tail adaptor